MIWQGEVELLRQGFGASVAFRFSFLSLKELDARKRGGVDWLMPCIHHTHSAFVLIYILSWLMRWPNAYSQLLLFYEICHSSPPRRIFQHDNGFTRSVQHSSFHAIQASWFKPFFRSSLLLSPMFLQTRNFLQPKISAWVIQPGVSKMPRECFAELHPWELHWC